MQTKSEIEELITRHVSQRREVEFAYLFGSFTHHERFEDIDVAVFLNDTTVLRDRKTHPYGYESTLLGELSSLLHIDAIDFVVLNKAGLTLFTRVINSGKKVFERDRIRRIYVENSIRKQFIDSKPLRDIQNYYLAMRLKDSYARS